jgi:KaiC/GvpD/RAD55 family RecA-like ATPase
MDYSMGITNLPWEIPPSTNIILSGDLFSGKDIMSRFFIKEGLKNDEACILVSTNDTAEKIVENLEGFKLDNFSIIDCVSSRFGATIELPFFEQIRYIENPMDLTMIMVALNEFMDLFILHKNIKRIRVVIDSVSTLLMYSNLRTVFKFLHVLTTRVKSFGGVCVLLMEEMAHDDIEVRTIQQLSQGLIRMTNNIIQIKGFMNAQLAYELQEDQILLKM